MLIFKNRFIFRNHFNKQMTSRYDWIGLLSEIMYMETSKKEEAYDMLNKSQWENYAGEDYVNEGGWFFKTLAAQEPGEDSVLAATYGRRYKNVSASTHLLPFFGTDYGLCR